VSYLIPTRPYARACLPFDYRFNDRLEQLI